MNKIIKESIERNKTLRNKIEDANKKNCDIMKEVEKIKILYKDVLKKIQQYNDEIDKREDIKRSSIEGKIIK